MVDVVSQIPDIPSELEFDHWNFLEKLKTSIKSIDSDLTSHTHTLDWLSNVACPAPADNNVIRYNATTKLWENVAPAAGLGLTDSAFKTITGITNDVVADDPHDTLTLASANNKLSIVGTTATDTITFTINEANINHNQLNGIQGGAVGDYYHLTAVQRADLTDGNNCSIHKHDDLYYTETELDAGQLDNRYFRENEHLNVSAGAGDSGKPIKLDADGHIDASMINDGDIDHTLIGSIGVNTHAQIDTHIGDGTKHFLEGSIDHGSIVGLGDSADHAWALLIDGTRSLTGDWNIGDFKLGINTVPTSPLHIKQSPGDETAATAYIDVDPTGTLTGAKSHTGFDLNLHTTVNRDANIYLVSAMSVGVYTSGAADVTSIYGLSFDAQHNAATTLSSLYSVFIKAQAGGGPVTNLYGAKSELYVSSSGSASAVYGFDNQISMGAAGNTLSIAYSHKARIIQSNGTLTTGYLFHGSYSGTIGTKWGIYLTGETKSYLAGYLGIGDSTNTEKLNVAGNLMLSGSSNHYIKTDTHAAGSTSIYFQGAGTTNGSIIAIGTGATSVGHVYASYGGVYTANHIEMKHDGSQGHIITGAGDLKLNPVGNVQIANGKYLFTDEVRARDSGGLYLRDDTGTLGMFIEDGGQVGFGTDTPGYDFHFAKTNTGAAALGGVIRSDFNLSGNVAGGNVSQVGHYFITNLTVVGTQADGTRQTFTNLVVTSSVTTPGNIYHHEGVYIVATHNHTTNTNGLYGGRLFAINNSTGTVAVARGFYGIVSNQSTGVMTSAFGLSGTVWNTAAGTVSTAYGVYSHIWRNAGTIATGFLYYGSYSGTIGTKWGLYLTGETKNYLSGILGIGVAPPANALLALNTPTEDTEFIDAGSTAATEQDWIQVEIGGITGYIRVFAAK